MMVKPYYVLNILNHSSIWTADSWQALEKEANDFYHNEYFNKDNKFPVSAFSITKKGYNPLELKECPIGTNYFYKSSMNNKLYLFGYNMYGKFW